MSVGLTIADAGSGVATATVSGSAGGSTNTVFYSSFNGLSTSAWAALGSITGDGTLSVSPGVGSWAWQCLSVDSGTPTLSNVFVQALEDSTVAVHYQACLSIQSLIIGLALQDMPSDNVVVQWLPTAFSQADPTPGCMVCPAGIETQPGELTGLDDIGYGVQVILYDAQNASRTANLARNLLWRQRIFRKVRQQRLPGVSSSLMTFVEPKLVIDPTLFLQANLWGTGLLIRPISRERRGV